MAAPSSDVAPPTSAPFPGCASSPCADAPHAERTMREVAADPGANVWQGRFSPDGRWIVFNTIKPTAAEVSTVYVVAATGGRVDADLGGRLRSTTRRAGPRTAARSISSRIATRR